MTDRRGPSIRTLYWQAGFAWSCDYYVKQALRQIKWNNFNHVETCADEPVQLAAVHGHFYNDPAYTHANVPPANRLLRGDTRGPKLIDESNGFQPRNIDNRWDYKPWWLGNALGDTISTTTVERLAIEAGPFARGGTPEGDLPQWLLNNVPEGRRRGYVYQIANIEGNAVRMTEKDQGLEEVFLAIPMKRLVKCWVVDGQRFTYGPIPLPIPTEAWPLGAGWRRQRLLQQQVQPEPAWSLLRHTLA